MCGKPEPIRSMDIYLQPAAPRSDDANPTCSLHTSVPRVSKRVAARLTPVPCPTEDPSVLIITAYSPTPQTAPDPPAGSALGLRLNLPSTP